MQKKIVFHARAVLSVCVLETIIYDGRCSLEHDKCKVPSEARNKDSGGIFLVKQLVKHEYGKTQCG